MRFRVVLVPFPFDDLSAGSFAQPYASPRAFIAKWCSPFISTIPTMLEPTDILLTPETPNFATTGLRVRSTLRLHRMVTVSTAIIRRQMGVLPPIIQAQVQQR